jgi:hypothetical protein
MKRNHSPSTTRAPSTFTLAGFTLIELLTAIGLLAVVIAVLLPLFSRMRRSAIEKKLSAQGSPAFTVGAGQALSDAEREPGAPPPPGHPPAGRPAARVTSFSAKVGLTPRLSVGTAEPESIYEATFSAKIEAAPPAGPPNLVAAAAAPAGGPDETEYEIPLPLPPQIISLADLSVTADGRPSQSVAMRDGRLVWHGPLSAAANTALDVTYTAVGKGLYELHTPPADVLETFQIDLTANGSDVRMLELSLQPTGLRREADKTTYTWDYKRLMFGRPIALDVLGIAPIDRLGELAWLGPVSVVVFGLLIGLIASSYQVANFDRWTLLLVLGTFTAAYPLMYFAQQFIPLPWAVLASAGVAVAVIGWRAASIMRPRLALFGVLVPASLILAVTLGAAVRPQLQGLLLTAEAMAFFVLATVLMPRAEANADAGRMPNSAGTLSPA